MKSNSLQSYILSIRTFMTGTVCNEATGRYNPSEGYPDAPRGDTGSKPIPSALKALKQKEERTREILQKAGNFVLCTSGCGFAALGLATAQPWLCLAALINLTIGLLFITINDKRKKTTAEEHLDYLDHIRTDLRKEIEIKKETRKQIEGVLNSSSQTS